MATAAWSLRSRAVTSKPCAFCHPGFAVTALWESEHYRIVPDGFPRCAGHLLLVSKEHLPSHMHAPRAWMDEFLQVQARMRAFLHATFGSAAFYENGARRQEVPHAHLHGLPFTPDLPARWFAAEDLEQVSSWLEVRRERKRVGYYFYLETERGVFLIRSYHEVLRGVRDQLVGQTEARLDPNTGRMSRGGPEMVTRTRQLWGEWERRLGKPAVGRPTP